MIWFIYLKGISDCCETSPREARIEKEWLRKEGSDPDKRCPWPESGWCPKWYWDCTCIFNIQKIRFADGLDMVWERKREWRIISYIWPEQLMNGGVTDRGYGRGRANMMKIRDQKFNFRCACLRWLLCQSGDVRWVIGKWVCNSRGALVYRYKGITIRYVCICTKPWEWRNHQANSKHILRREEIQRLSLVGSQQSILGRWREWYKGDREGRTSPVGKLGWCPQSQS